MADNDTNPAWDDDLPPDIITDDLDDQPASDEPLAEGEVLDPTEDHDSDNSGTAYTSPATLVGVVGGDPIVPEPIPDDTDAAVLPSKVAAIIRTVSPYIVGWLLSGLLWLVGVVGLDITLPEGVEGALTQAVPWVLGTAYYALARYVLEKRWPGVPWLGSTRQPLYTPPAAAADVRPAVATLARAGYVWWRGGKFTPAFRDSLVEADAMVPGFVLTQGGFNGTSVAASAGTHAGDSADFSVRGKTREQVAAFIEAHRKVGNFASFRTTKVGKWGTRAQGFTSYHVHVVPNGWGAPSAAARRQINHEYPKGTKRGYRNGRDGLGSNGIDTGPGHTGAYRTRTWWDFQKGKAAALAAQRAAQAAQEAAKRYAIPRVTTPKPWPVIAVDGILGPQTVRRLQMTLQVALTGKLDHYTVRALKVWLGNKDDGKGILSPLHVKQLQYRVGFRGKAQDGVWGPVTTTALQKMLNATR